jgi:hypothetical protein
MPHPPGNPGDNQHCEGGRRTVKAIQHGDVPGSLECFDQPGWSLTLPGPDLDYLEANEILTIG